MSSYMHFFIRHNDDFICINTFSRGTKCYETFYNYVPFEKIKLITMRELNLVSDLAEENIAELKLKINSYKEAINRVSNFGDNSVSEKEEQIYIYVDCIEQQQLEIEEYEAVVWFITFLRDFIFEQDDDSENHLYAGIECYKPTLEDIV